MRSLRGTVSFVVLLFIVGVAAANGCSPVKTPVPTPDIAAIAKAAAATAVASQPTPDVAATAEAVVAAAVASQLTPDVAATVDAVVTSALASQPTPDIPATVRVAVATAMATQTDQAELTATPTSSSHTATPAVTTQVEPPALPPSVAALVVKSETVALVTCRDHFVIIDAGVLRANADPDKRDEKERFTLLYLNNEKVAFRTSDGRFITATFDEPWVLIAEETQDLRGTQQFTLGDLTNGRFSIKTVYNRYVTAMDDQPDWNWELRAETQYLGDWEKFELVSLAE